VHILAPNVRSVPKGLLEALGASENPSLQGLLGEPMEEGATRRSGVGDNVSVIRRLIHQLFDGLSMMDHTHLHAVVCLAPWPHNDVETIHSLNKTLLLQQMEAWGTTPAVRFKHVFNELVAGGLNIKRDAQWTRADKSMDHEGRQAALVQAFERGHVRTEDDGRSAQANILSWLEQVDVTKAALKIQASYRRWIVKLKYKRLGAMFKRLQVEVRRFIVLERYGDDLRHDLLESKMKQQHEGVAQVQEDLLDSQRKKAQADKRQRAQTIIEETLAQMAAEQGAQPDDSTHSSERRPEEAFHLPLPRPSDGGDDAAHARPRSHGHRDFTVGLVPPGEEGLQNLEYHQYTGTETDKRLLLASLAQQEAMDRDAVPPVRRTPNNSNFIPPEMVPPPPAMDPGHNHPTAAVPDDLMHMLSTYAEGLDDSQHSSWRAVSPPRTGPPPQLALGESLENLKSKTQELMNSNPPPPPLSGNPVGRVQPKGQTRYGVPGSNYIKKYGRKYEQRRSGEALPGYESMDSSRSENSVASTLDSYR